MYKRLTPCIFIERGKAVQWFDDRTVIADDVMELARHYNERGADELIIFDLSDSDEEHDERNGHRLGCSAVAPQTSGVDQEPSVGSRSASAEAGAGSRDRRSSSRRGCG